MSTQATAAVADLDLLAVDLPVRDEPARDDLLARTAPVQPAPAREALPPILAVRLARRLAALAQDPWAVLLPLGFALGVIAVWEFAVWFFDYPEAILPAPSVVAGTLFERGGLLLENAVPTAMVALGGFLIATVLGVGLAVIMTWSTATRDALYPNIVAFQIVPKVAWAPMFVLWLGIETEARLGFATFISVFPIIINMTAGLANTDPSMLRLCQALTASKWQTLVHVRFPYALPFLFSAMKMSITLAMIGVIVGEFITSQQGLGFVILTAASRAEADLMMASVVMLCLMGLLFYAMVALGTWLVDRWFGK